MRILLFVLLTLIVAWSPLGAPAMAAGLPMEHCQGDQHPAPQGAPDGKSVMSHQGCCVAVDPEKAAPVADPLAPTLAIDRPINDLRLASTVSGTDPPPPRTA